MSFARAPPSSGSKYGNSQSGCAFSSFATKHVNRAMCGSRSIALRSATASRERREPAQSETSPITIHVHPKLSELNTRLRALLRIQAIECGPLYRASSFPSKIVRIQAKSVTSALFKPCMHISAVTVGRGSLISNEGVQLSAFSSSMNHGMAVCANDRQIVKCDPSTARG